MGTIAWQYGQVGDWNFTRLGRDTASASASKLLESSTTSLVESPPPVGEEVVGTGLERRIPQKEEGSTAPPTFVPRASLRLQERAG